MGDPGEVPDGAASLLTFRELSTFASLAYLVCTTTERVPKVLEDSARPVGFLTSEVWQALLRAAVERLP